MQKNSTLGSIVSLGNTSGFDYLRLGLSISVLAWHSSGIVYGREWAHYLATTYLGNFIFLILPAFFALSGFLVASSLMRCSTLPEFLGLRFLRLIPALAVEIGVSAIILGPLLTNLNLYAYFTDQKYFQYFFNIIGWIHYELPGVYTQNAIPSVVNGSLWTVPYELECYIALALLWIIRLRSSLTAVALALAGWCVLLAVATYANAYVPVRADAIGGRMLVAYFLAGVLLFHAKDKIPHDRRLFLASSLISVFLIKSSIFIFVTPLFIAYSTVYIGLLRPQKIPYIFKGDYSYGIYLYAFPIQQAVYQLFPNARSWIEHFSIALLFTALLATFSWHFIEKPTLKLKRLLKARSSRSEAFGTPKTTQS